MRALFFGDTPHRFAGAQKSLLLSLGRLGEHGIDPIVVFPHEGIFQKKCVEAGLDVRILEAPPAFHSYGRALMRLSTMSAVRVVARELWPYARELARLADQVDARVLHFNTARGLTMAGPAAHLSGRRAVMHLRGVPAIGRAYWAASQALGDAFVLVARALLPSFAPSVRPRCHVVYNGVEPKPVIPREVARAALARELSARGVHFDPHKPLFVSVSSITPFKGLHHLVAAAEQAQRRGLDATYLFAGHTPGDRYEAWLRERVLALGLQERVHFLGFWEDVHALMSAADATVLPSVQEETLVVDGASIAVHGTEGLPRAVLESFAAEVPPIASRVAGVEEQIEDGRTGLIVEPGDPAALSNALVRVAGDAELRSRIGRAGREMVLAKFSIAAAARGLAEVLREEAAPPVLGQRLAAWARLAPELLYHG